MTAGGMLAPAAGENVREAGGRIQVGPPGSAPPLPAAGTECFYTAGLSPGPTGWPREGTERPPRSRTEGDDNQSDSVQSAVLL